MSIAAPRGRYGWLALRGLSALLGVLLALPMAWAGADTHDALDEALRQVATRRERSLAGFEAEDAACYQRFAVNACLKDVQTRRLALLAGLRREEAALHERQRALDGSEQARERQEKVRQHQQLREDAVTDAQPPPQQRQQEKQQEKQQDLQQRRAEHAARAQAVQPRPAPSPGGPSAAQQADNRAAYARKLQDAEDRRKDMARRLAEQAGKAPVAPLPPVPAASR